MTVLSMYTLPSGPGNDAGPPAQAHVKDSETEGRKGAGVEGKRCIAVQLDRFGAPRLRSHTAPATFTGSRPCSPNKQPTRELDQKTLI
jgi:hypothetical protein